MLYKKFFGRGSDGLNGGCVIHGELILKEIASCGLTLSILWPEIDRLRNISSTLSRILRCRASVDMATS